MKERAIITTLTLTKPFEYRHFQVRIPRDAVHICGVEATGRFIGKAGSVGKESNDFLYRRNYLFGDLWLQSCEEANRFYTGEIRANDINTVMSDFSIPPTWKAKEWTNGGKQEAETVIVDGDTTVVNGLYRDKTGKEITAILGYEIKVVIWYKTNE